MKLVKVKYEWFDLTEDDDEIEIVEYDETNITDDWSVYDEIYRIIAHWCIYPDNIEILEEVK